MKTAEKLKRVGCCESGINPKAVYDFVKNCEERNLGLDMFMLLKGGKVVAEGYYPPYNEDTRHVLYSMSKSFTATALGFAIEEGKVALSDSISKFFPEYDKKGKNKNITVRHLVTMTAGKMIGMATVRTNKDWIKIFFDSMSIAKPGKIYLYTNDNFYMLSAIVSKVTGMTLADYLYEKLFVHLDIEKPTWETDKFGYASGGWGLYMKLEDQAKVMQCYANGGVWNGKQIIPAEWVKQATTFQVPTLKHGQIDVTKGYGYGFWRTSLPNTYRAYGLYGQNGYVFEDKDTVLIVNAGISKDALMCEAINEMYKTLWDEPEEEYEEKLKELLSSLGDKDDLPVQVRNERLENEICDKSHHTYIPTTFSSMLHATMTAVMNDKTGYLKSIFFRKDENNDMYLEWTEAGHTNKIKLGFDNKYECTPVKLSGLDYHIHTKAAWTSGKVLTVYLRIEEACHLRVLEFDFSGKMPIIRNNSYPDMPTLAAHYVDFSGFELPNPLEKLLIKVIAPAVLLVGEPNYIVK